MLCQHNLLRITTRVTTKRSSATFLRLSELWLRYTQQCVGTCSFLVVSDVGPKSVYQVRLGLQLACARLRTWLGLKPAMGERDDGYRMSSGTR